MNTQSATVILQKLQQSLDRYPSLPGKSQPINQTAIKKEKITMQAAFFSFPSASKPLKPLHDSKRERHPPLKSVFPRLRNSLADSLMHGMA